MAAVPTVAIERLRKLEQKVEGWRAQYADLQDGFQHARGEVSRLESQLQNAAYASGRRLEVDDQGRVFYREQRGGGGVRRTVGYVTRTDQPDGPHETVRYVDDAALAATGRTIARLRNEAADWSCRRDELAEKIAPVASLADACRRHLLAMGWQETEHAILHQGTTVNVRGAA
jgi:hypothetical protein